MKAVGPTAAASLILQNVGTSWFCVRVSVCAWVWVLSNCLPQLDVVLIICNFLKHRLDFDDDNDTAGIIIQGSC